jgi:4-hydroxybenzoate polyprenyltransferase
LRVNYAPLMMTLFLCAMSAFLASRKGYHPLIWFFCAGLIGLVVLVCLPYANLPDQTPEERARLRRNGNRIGLLIVMAAAVVFIARLLPMR